jgi:hypothetical protein
MLGCVKKSLMQVLWVLELPDFHQKAGCLVSDKITKKAFQDKILHEKQCRYDELTLDAISFLHDTYCVRYGSSKLPLEAFFGPKKMRSAFFFKLGFFF